MVSEGLRADSLMAYSEIERSPGRSEGSFRLVPDDNHTGEYPKASFRQW